MQKTIMYHSLTLRLSQCQSPSPSPQFLFIAWNAVILSLYRTDLHFLSHCLSHCLSLSLSLSRKDLHLFIHTYLVGGYSESRKPTSFNAESTIPYDTGQGYRVNMYVCMYVCILRANILMIPIAFLCHVHVGEYIL